MKNQSRLFPHTLAALLMSLACSTHVLAHGHAAEPQAPQLTFAPTALGVNGKLPPPAEGVTDLKFKEMYRMPIGPKGLEPTDKLLSLNGKKVRMVGYMVTQEKAYSDFLILTSLPVQMGDEDESLSDDLPPSAVFVHLAPGLAAKGLPNIQGLIQLTGTLRTGSREEPDGHVSSVRLELDAETSEQLAKLSLKLARE